MLQWALAAALEAAFEGQARNLGQRGEINLGERFVEGSCRAQKEGAGLCKGCRSLT